jgi:hypothetical protein
MNNTTNVRDIFQEEKHVKPLQIVNNVPNQILMGVEQHPDYQQWESENRKWNAFEQNTTNNQTNAAKTFDGLYPYNGQVRYFGYRGGDRYTSLFCDRSIKFMSEMITNGLKNVHPEGKNIIVPDETIKSVADSIFEGSFSDAKQMQMMVVNLIIKHIINEYDTIEKNNKLSIWITKYDTNSGMKKFDGIKLNDKQRSHSGYWKY